MWSPALHLPGEALGTVTVQPEWPCSLRPGSPGVFKETSLLFCLLNKTIL